MVLRGSFFLLLCLLVPLLMGCEQGDWEEARAVDTAAAYERFLAEHPEGRFSAGARARLRELQEPDEWSAARSAGTLRHVRLFLDKYPSGRFAEAARQELARLEEDEEAAWKRASRKDSVEFYQAYLEAYSEERHSGEARARMEELQTRARAESERLWQATARKVDAAYARLRRSVELAGTLEQLQGEQRRKAAMELIMLVGSLREDIEFFEAYATPDDPRRTAVAALKQVVTKAGIE